MNKNNYLDFDQSRYDGVRNTIEQKADIFISALDELKKNGVRGFTAENLTEGNFVELFHLYHKEQFKKSKFLTELNIRYEKYLELKEFTTAKLEELEAEYQKAMNLEFDLYDFNNGFFHYCENEKHNSNFANAMKFAPQKRTYKIFDFLKFKGNKAIIDVPKKPFEIYALNKRQISFMQAMANFVDAARIIGLNSNHIRPHIEQYLKRENGNVVGLDADLKNVEFNDIQILSSKL